MVYNILVQCVLFLTSSPKCVQVYDLAAPQAGLMFATLSFVLGLVKPWGSND